MKISEVSVTGLFGLFDHVVPLTNTVPMTIVHGRNGIGKTALLRLFSAFLEGDSSRFEQTRFTEFVVTLEDRRAVVIRKSAEQHPDRSISVVIRDAEGVERDLEGTAARLDVPNSVLDAIDRHVPTPYQRSSNGWRRGTSSKILGLDEILEIFPSLARRVPSKYRSNVLSSVGEELGISLSVFLVETTRLAPEAKVVDDTPEWSVNNFVSDEVHISGMPDMQRTQFSRVDQYSSDIIRRIKSTLADYAKSSQESDRTYPERLVRFLRESFDPFTDKEIVEKMSELEQKRQRLISLGFLDSEGGLRDLSEDDVRRAPEALTIYVKDVEQKLAVFDDLARKVGKLTDIVNDRFSYKTLTFHREDGFTFKSSLGEKIHLKDLSSGEQHELVVLYELLFRAPKNGIVLIDEPEISLHAGWQTKFLDDLADVLQLIDCYAVVATHSPLIIGPRWDLARELSGPPEGAARS